MILEDPPYAYHRCGWYVYLKRSLSSYTLDVRGVVLSNNRQVCLAMDQAAQSRGFFDTNSIEGLSIFRCMDQSCLSGWNCTRCLVDVPKSPAETSARVPWISRNQFVRRNVFLWVLSTVARSIKAFDVAGRLLLRIITVLIDDREQLEWTKISHNGSKAPASRFKNCVNAMHTIVGH
jgi:hypothetical protein